MLTKEQFLADMKKGWEVLEYTRNAFWAVKGDFYGYTTMVATHNRDETQCACAIGAAAYAAHKNPEYYSAQIPYGFAAAIAQASDTAGEKEAAIRMVEQRLESATKW